jgi:hypothetical protein
MGGQAFCEVFCCREMERKDEGGNEPADDEKRGDESERPAFSRERVWHVVNMFWERAEKQRLEHADDVNGV